MERFLPKTEFGRNVVTVMSGTAFAQAIPVLASPLLTRLFGPAEFGLFALYLSIVTIAAVVVTGRYELAILIPADDREAFDLLAAAVGLAAVMCAAILVLLALAGHLFADLGAVQELGVWLYFIPLSVFLTALFQSLSYWVNRRSHYRRLVHGRMVQSGAMCGVQLGLGAGGLQSGGLVAGHLCGQLAANSLLLRSTWREDRAVLADTTLDGVRQAALTHRRFPFFMVPGHLANATSSQMPVIMLSALFGPAVAGFYSVAERVLVLPTSVIGSAIGDVYRQQAAQAYQRSGECRALYLSTLRKLAILGFLPCLTVVLAGPWLFGLVFGTFWREAGEIAAVLAVMVYFQIMSSPLSQTVLLSTMHRLELVWQIARLALSVASIYLGYYLANDYRLSVLFYAASFAVLHVLHSLMQYYVASGAGADRPVASP